MPRLSHVNRAALEAEVRHALVRGVLCGTKVDEIALRYNVTSRSVYSARRRVLDRLRAINPTERGRERRATLLMLDSYTTAAASAGKFREALQGLKLRVDLLGLKATDDGDDKPRAGAQSVDELLQVIGEAAALRETLEPSVVHEDDGEE